MVIGKDGNSIDMKITGKRKREVGMVLPTDYTAMSASKKNATKLSEKILERQRQFPGLELTYTPNDDIREYAVYK